MNIYIPDGTSQDTALKRTTHMTIAAHPDDIELTSMAIIGKCMEDDEKYFTGVVVSDGSSSPRTGAYADTTDKQMVNIRAKEQEKAAQAGKYNALVMLGYTSAQIKNPEYIPPHDELAALIEKCRPEYIFTHNPADRHDTHVAVMLRVIRAIKSLPEGIRPKRLIGCEVWRTLDWLPDGRKIMLDTSRYSKLSKELLGVFESQIAGGKQYDLAFYARQHANATFSQSHSCDEYECASIALDMTSLILDNGIEPEAFITNLIEEFKAEVTARILG